MKKPIALLAALALGGTASHAASVAVSIDQGAYTSNSNVVSLTTEGTMDWWVLQSNRGTGSLTPSDRKNSTSGGSITSLVTGGSTGATTLVYSDAQNDYTWTDGTTATVGGLAANFDRVLFGNGSTMTLTVDVNAAGTYRLGYYTTVFNLAVAASSSLTNGGVSDTGASTATGGLSKNYWFIDFTTDGADTLTTTFTSSGPNNIFAQEAITLIPEPSSAALAGIASLVLLGRRRKG